MSFEERLLDGLKQEIERRERGAVVHGSRPRRSLTPRRITVALAACAALVLAPVAVPGSPADTKAYAVEHRGDGSVQLTIEDQELGVGEQRELARKVGAWGVHVIVDVLEPGYVCDRSEVEGALVSVDGAPLVPFETRWDVTLRRGNVLAFENTRGAVRPRAVEFYATQDQAEPCVPRKVALPAR